jgi:cell division protein FtsN
MKNTETGEFELVLGNRQLLSGFFVVVILFAVFFVMGYIVGRNSSPPSKLASSDMSNSALPAPSETRPQPPPGNMPAPQTQQPAAPETAKESVPDMAGDAQPTTQPAREQQPTTQPARESQPDIEVLPSASNSPAEPAPGETYLQVLAVRQQEAEVVARTLKDKGFPSLLAPAPKGLTRVLVGPYSDTASLGKAKAGLESAGFHPIVKR